jgi:acyl carrier protein
MDDFGALPDDAVALVMIIEEALGIEISDEEAEAMPDFNSVQEALEYFRKLRKGGEQI